MQRSSRDLEMALLFEVKQAQDLNKELRGEANFEQAICEPRIRDHEESESKVKDLID